MDYSVEALTEALNRGLFEVQEKMGEEPGGAGVTSQTLPRLHEIWMEAVAEHADPLAALHEEVARTVPPGHPLGPGPDVSLPHLLMLVRYGRGEGSGGVFLG